MVLSFYSSVVLTFYRSAGKRITLVMLCCFFVFSSLLYAQEEFRYNSQGKRNPFIALVTADGRFLQLDQESEKRQEMLLEGIIYDKYGVSCAVIEGQVVKTGDTLGDYQVLKIEKNQVLLIKEGQIKALELQKEE